MDESRLRRPAGRRRARTKGNVTLYITDEDVDVWERADEYVIRQGVSLSSLVAEALQQYLDRQES